jgi:transcriptional regulator with XRE-family HTH domain
MVAVPKNRPRTKSFLRAWRVHRGLSQEAAASRLDLDRTTLSKIENGKVPYNQVLLEMAAEAYGCEPADLIMRDPKSEVWSLLETVRKLPPDQQNQISGMIKGFLAASKTAA